MPFSTPYANQILSYTLSKTMTLTAPEFVYLGLCSNDPEADNGTFTELSGGNYSRVLIVQRNQSFPALIGSASNRKITNNGQITGNKATAQLTAKGFGLFSAATGGTPFFYGKLAQEVVIPVDAVPLFEAGAFGLEFLATDAE